MSNFTSYPNGISLTSRKAIQKLVDKVQVIRAFHSDGTSEVLTGFNLPANSIVTGVYLYIRTAETVGTTPTIDVGISGVDAKGYMDTVSVGSTGIVKGTLESGSVTKGSLLRVDVTGTSNFSHEDDVSSGGGEISWTPGSSDFGTLDLDIIIKYLEVV